MPSTLSFTKTSATPPNNVAIALSTDARPPTLDARSPNACSSARCSQSSPIDDAQPMSGQPEPPPERDDEGGSGDGAFVDDGAGVADGASVGARVDVGSADGASVGRAEGNDDGVDDGDDEVGDADGSGVVGRGDGERVDGAGVRGVGGLVSSTPSKSDSRHSATDFTSSDTSCAWCAKSRYLRRGQCVSATCPRRGRGGAAT